MDYLLLTYSIYHLGLVPPHIAAGINLNFFPAGGIFRRSGAFIRRSFAGNKLYSSVFKEYLSQLFIKGYSVKFYTEGGRSRLVFVTTKNRYARHDVASHASWHRSPYFYFVYIAMST